MKIFLLSILIIYALFPVIESSAAEELLWYTVQTSSHTKQIEAENQFRNLSKELPPSLQDHLRIEFVKPYYTIRVGKFKTRLETKNLLESLKQLKKQPIILHAYIKNERLIKITSPDKEPSAKTSLPLQTQTKKIELSEEKKAIKETEEITSDNSTSRSPLPADKLSPLEKIPFPSERKEEQPVLNENYEKLIIAKYIDTSHHVKDVAEAQKQMDKHAQTPGCLTSECHTDIATVTQPHAPAQKEKCQACHKRISTEHPSDSTSFEMQAEGADLCRQCHMKIIAGKSVHAPAADGECNSCHNPHGSDFPSLLKVQKNDVQLCMDCHDSSITDHKYKHGPVGMGACTQCHNPHAADNDFLLRDTPQELCTTCHSDFIDGLNDSKYVHTAVKQQGCQSCHSVHGSDYPNLLNLSQEKFCFSCHPEVEEKFEKSRTKHAGLYLEKHCRTCHLAHYSDHDNLLIKEKMELCLSCHNSYSSVGSYSPFDIESELRNKEFIHAPVASGECTSCHDQHGAANDKLLKGAYPSTFYEPYSPDKYELCFICHPRELLTEKITADSTDFRNGQQNLHFTHVGIEQKGRTCQACHRSHASDGPKLISRTGATFGVWTMSIDFFITETGGSCMPGCHRELAYDRETPLIYSKKEADFGTPFIDYQKK